MKITLSSLRAVRPYKAKWLNLISAEVERAKQDGAPTLQSVEHMKGRYDQLHSADIKDMPPVERALLNGVTSRLVALLSAWAIFYRLDPEGDDLPRLLVAAAKAAVMPTGATGARSAPMSQRELVARILNNNNARTRDVDLKRFDLQQFKGRKWTISLHNVDSAMRERLSKPAR